MLNDKRELAEGLALIGMILQAKTEFSARKRPRGKPSSFEQRFRLMSFLTENLAEGEEADVYVASFSAKMDSLSQWRAYGANLAGCAIGFRTDKLKNAFSEAELVQVQYFKPGRNGGILSSAKSDINAVMAKLDSIAGLPPDQIRSKILQLAASIKHLSFCEEAEWRLIVVDHERVVKFRERGRTIIPYVELNATAEDGERIPLPVRSVWIHPCEPHQARGIQLKLLETLSRQGYHDVIVRPSSIPYRTE